jgi:predicted Rossmann fold nucleotide-binding protein DprA/Smf involved in DNA uptake
MLLLTAWFNKPAQGDPRPLSPAEWGRFAQWLKDRDTTPECLLASDDPTKHLSSFSDQSITPDRIARLLGRSAALGLALEKWQRAGLWIMSRSEADYPARLKRRLNVNAPPVLFGCGNRHLLDQGGVAVIGSRDATDEDLAFTSRLACDIAMQGYSVVSGGARGVDEAAMLAALEKEGTVIGVLADSLLRMATSAKYRKGLMAKNLVLVSPFNPEAGFDVGNAMARNKYVYCLADAAVVVATGKNKGGTWNGAIENIKQVWVPLWVKPHPDSGSGNAALVKNGGCWLPEGTVDVRALIKPVEKPRSEPFLPGVFDDVPPTGPTQQELEEPSVTASYACTARTDGSALPDGGPVTGDSSVNTPVIAPQSLYDCFLAIMERETRLSPETPEALQQRLDVGKAQLNDWLKRAVSEGKVARLNRPVRYQSTMAG